MQEAWAAPAGETPSGLGALWLVPLLAAVAALGIQFSASLNPDVSWLLTVNDKMLAGEQAYKDILEVNPPASILLYWLPARLGQWLQLRAEAGLAFGLAAIIFTTTLFVLRIGTRNDIFPRADCFLIYGTMGVAISILPMSEFAQREHFAVLFILPYALAFIARLDRKDPGQICRMACGLLLGLCIAIKPYFALCPLLTTAYAAGLARNAKPLWVIEHWVAGAVVVAYSLSAYLYFPDFFHSMLPLLTDLYLPVRNGPDVLALRIGVGIVLPLVVCGLFGSGPASNTVITLLLVSLGFLLALVIQGKGFANHVYPVTAFALMACAVAASHAAPRIPSHLAATLVAVAILFAVPKFNKPDPGNKALAQAISAIRPKPKLLAIGLPFSLGHPLVRDIGGTWTGATGSQWITAGALLMKERASDDIQLQHRADAYLDYDRQITAASILRQKPDIVLVEQTPAFDFSGWIEDSPQLRTAMADYSLATSVGNIQVFAKNRRYP